MSGAEARRLAMFPLGTVLFPGATLPLHIFEPRYRAMIRDCLDQGAGFGIVLIARGSEVGGGDQRFGVGTLARIEEAAELDDGRWVALARGASRIEVAEWLPEEPYPLASVGTRPSAGSVTTEALGEALRLLRRAGALAEELGAPGVRAAAPDPGEDPEASLWRLCDAAPVGALDRQRLLEADDLGERTAVLCEMLAGVGDDLLALLAQRGAG
jgi:uncharacterized protein